MKKLLSFSKRVRGRIGQILHSFRFTMIGSVFLIMLTSGILAGGTVTAIYLSRPEWISDDALLFPLVIITLPTSIVLGTIFSIIVSKQLLRPVDDLIQATEEVARGNLRVEVPIRYKKNQFSRLIKSFNAMTRELSGIEIFRNDFINNFSHEFKTPLSSIRGFARELRNKALTEEEREEYLRIIIEACDRLSGMASSVLLLTKLENQQFITDRESFDIAEQLRDSILLLEKLWTKKNIDWQLDLEEAICISNAEMLSHVWLNLLSNAIKFSPNEGGTITVTCQKKGALISVSVKDEGAGIEPDVMAHIFEKFYQGDTSHKAEGNGLGLPLVKRIVEISGGSISVDSTPKKGALFLVTLPQEPALLPPTSGI
jgi:signal transduction histidine kinase